MAKNNLNNKSYSKEEKDAILKQLLPPNNKTLSEVHADTKIPKSTLCSWKNRELRKRGKTNTTKAKNITASKKLLAVTETSTMNELEIGRYCRENGYFIEEITEWRKVLLNAFDNESIQGSNVKEDLNEEKKKNKSLSKELKRKEKALAEAAALLVLQKKFQAFMEEEED